MMYCKYCGFPMTDGQTSYCDVACKNMARVVAGTLKLPQEKAIANDKFSAFAEAQRKAERRGIYLSYGDWQNTKYPNKITKKGKE